MLIKYNNIIKELNRVDLSVIKLAKILGITPMAVYSRIKKGDQSIHLITYALSHYYDKNG